MEEGENVPANPDAIAQVRIEVPKDETIKEKTEDSKEENGKEEKSKKVRTKRPDIDSEPEEE